MPTILQYTKIDMENPMFFGEYHQNGGFSMAMLVYHRVCLLYSSLCIQMIWGGSPISDPKYLLIMYYLPYFLLAEQRLAKNILAKKLKVYIIKR